MRQRKKGMKVYSFALLFFNDNDSSFVTFLRKFLVDFKILISNFCNYAREKVYFLPHCYFDNFAIFKDVFPGFCLPVQGIKLNQIELNELLKNFAGA